jgi:hypothetical protein
MLAVEKSSWVKEMLSEYNTTIECLKSINKQLDEFVDESESGKILLSIPGIGVIKKFTKSYMVLCSKILLEGTVN